MKILAKFKQTRFHTHVKNSNPGKKDSHDKCWQTDLSLSRTTGRDFLWTLIHLLIALVFCFSLFSVIVFCWKCCQVTGKTVFFFRVILLFKPWLIDFDWLIEPREKDPFGVKNEKQCTIMNSSLVFQDLPSKQHWRETVAVSMNLLHHSHLSS